MIHALKRLYYSGKRDRRKRDDGPPRFATYKESGYDSYEYVRIPRYVVDKITTHERRLDGVDNR